MVFKWKLERIFIMWSKVSHKQRISVMDKFKKKIQEQAYLKKEESDKQFYGNRYTGKLESSPNGEQSKPKTHTDKELAKMAGVGTGTVAYDTKEQVMDWMLGIQLSSKNLTINERMNVVDDFKEEVKLDNEKKKLDGDKLGAAITNGKSVTLQLECEREKKHSDTWTDSQTAKKAGVGVGTVARYTKSDVMDWMLDIQLGRRNLSHIQRIAVTEKYRPIYEKQAQERQATSTGGVNPQLTQDFVEADKNKKRSENETNAKLAKAANVNRETYRQAKRVLDSDNEDVKQRVLSGETSISAGYKELTQSKKFAQI